MNLTTAESLAKRWMPGFRNGDAQRPSWMHPQDLVHLLRECATVSYIAINLTHLCIVAWMHDLLEDGVKEDGSPVTVEDLEAAGFDPVVIEDVVSLTKDKDNEGAYITQMENASWEAQIVKCIDRVCNLREGASVFRKNRWARYHQETLIWILPMAQDIPGDAGELLTSLLTSALDLRPVVKKPCSAD